MFSSNPRIPRCGASVMDYDRLYTGTRNTKFPALRVTVCDCVSTLKCVNYPLGHPCATTLRAWDWGPDALWSDVTFLADAILRDALAEEVDADEVQWREPGVWESIVADFAEEVVSLLPDRFSIWNGEVFAWATKEKDESQ